MWLPSPNGDGLFVRRKSPVSRSRKWKDRGSREANLQASLAVLKSQQERYNDAICKKERKKRRSWENRALTKFWSCFPDDVFHTKLCRIRILCIYSERKNPEQPAIGREELRQQFDRKPSLLSYKSRQPCFACGGRSHVRHHIIQLQHGGSNKKRNIVRLCHDCHAEIHPWLKHPRPRETGAGDFRVSPERMDGPGLSNPKSQSELTDRRSDDGQREHHQFANPGSPASSGCVDGSIPPPSSAMTAQGHTGT